MGPATLIMFGYETDDAVRRVSEHIARIMTDLKAEKIILFLDEPALGQAGFDFEELWLPIFSSFKVTPGVHCCGNMDWDKLFKSELIEIISFDASQFDITKYPHYRNGKRIAWGVEKKEDVKDFQPGDFLTLPCGMGTKLYTVRDCQKELKKLKTIATKLKVKNPQVTPMDFYVELSTGGILTRIWYNKNTMKPKVVIIFIVFLLLAAGAAYYFGYQRGYGKGMEVGRAAAQIGAEAAVETPLGEMPSTNPFEEAVNPFKDLYKNPFK